MQLEQPRPRSLALGAITASRLRVSANVGAWAAAIAIGGLTFVVYVATMAPSVMWYDMGEFAVVSSTLGIAHNTGYPLLILTGKALTFLPFGEAAWRVNLVSAVFTSLAIALTFATIRELTREYVGAAVGALTLAFASTVWANATWATSYGMNLFFVALISYLMFRWHRERTPRLLVFAALAFGLALCNHRLIVLVAPPSLMLIALGCRSLSLRTVALSGLAFLAGLSLYLYLPIRGEMEPPISWAQPAEASTYWSMFVNGQTPSNYWSIDFADRIDILWAYPSYDLTWAGLALAAAGLVVCAMRTRAIAAYLALLVVLTALIVETYAIHNIYNYLTPGYFALCVLIGIACSWVVDVVQKAGFDSTDDGGGAKAPRVHGAAFLNVRPHVRMAAVAAVLAMLPAFLLVKNYERVDRNGDYTAIDFARTTLDRMPPGAVILTDSWTASPLWYAQHVEGRRKDVLVSPIFSVQGSDPVEFAKQFTDAGDSVYVAEGLRVFPAVFEEQYAVQPVLLESIERMVTDSLPKPQYRDDLVMTGSLYKLVPAATAKSREQTPGGTAKSKEQTAKSVPAGAERDVGFESGVRLVGFEGDVSVERGNVAQFAYWWRADREIDVDLSAAVLFVDQKGVVAQRQGIPLWSQPRDIGQGVLETSEWGPGEVYRDSYFSLAPRTLAPGAYDIRIAVFDAASPTAAAGAAELVTIGSIVVR